ncbi:30S ribosomal protein S17e [Candidatus Woesearchaeota archaeon]|nr:30S ribosomal protein S17e [Candidatus Woesearchaeota archaeon]
MGRVKTVLIKRTSKKLFGKFGEEFTDDFTKNKEIVEKHTNIASRKIMNMVAGYATRLVKQSKQEKVPRKIVKEAT